MLRNQECTGSEDGRFFIVQKEADGKMQSLSGFSWFDQLEGVVSNIYQPPANAAGLCWA